MTLNVKCSFSEVRKNPKLYVWGSAREKILSRSANRPLDENDYHLTFSTFSSARQKAKLARKNCEILPKNNLPKTIDGRARPMRLLPHRMSLPTEGKPRSTRRRYREGRKKSSWKSLSETATRGKQKFICQDFFTNP